MDGKVGGGVEVEGGRGWEGGGGLRRSIDDLTVVCGSAAGRSR